MQIYDELHNKITKASASKGSVVVESDSESLYAKDILFKSGQKIVSDRDVFTLDYELTRYMSQTKGLRVLDDFIYPYTQRASKKESIKQSIEWIKHFPDPFLEEDLALVLKEFLSQEKDCEPFLKQLEEVSSLAQTKDSFKAVPRAYANLFLNDLSFTDQTVFLRTLLDKLPFGFSDQYTSQSINTGSLDPSWRDQVDLYGVFENDESLIFQNYSHQLDEVRSVLKHLSELENPEDTLVLYPRQSGYEKLFYLYQREFFEEQIFLTNRNEETTLNTFVKKLYVETNSLKTYHEEGFLNKNKILFGEAINPQISLGALAKKYFENDFTELDLNILSHVMTQIGNEKLLLLEDWRSIFENEWLKNKKKGEKISTRLNVKDYSYFPNFKPKEVWILGWGDHLFKKNGEKLFSESILARLEIDLGLDLPSLKKSPARELLSNPLINDKSVLKKICYSNTNFSGRSNKPGVFKILKEQSGVNSVNSIQRQKFRKTLNLERNRLTFESKNLSASSLQCYEDCPYKFYLEKVIGLETEDEEDYFLSAKEEGSLIHKVLEDVVKTDLTKEKFIENLKNLVKSEDKDFNHFREGVFLKLSEKLWSIVQEEKGYLKEHEILNVFVEKFFSFDVDVKNREFKEQGGDFTVRGVVDRLDVNKEGKAFLYDYKRGESGSHSLAVYKGTKLAPQLFLYCLAADRGFLGDFQKFVGFQYINIGSYKRIKGFVDKESGSSMAKEILRGSVVSSEKYEEKMNLFLEKFWSLLSEIANSNFEPKPNPLYSGVCESCTWVGVCKKSETFT